MKTGCRRLKHTKITITKDLAAFTMIELVLVMVIILTLAALTLPQFSGVFSRLKLEGTAEDVATLLRRAHLLAAERGLKVRFNIDLEEKRFWVSIEEEPLQAPGEFRPLQAAWAGPSILPEGIVFQEVDFGEEEVVSPSATRGLSADAGAEDFLEFKSSGECKDARIVLAADEETREIVIRGILGLARVKKDEEET